MAGNRGDNSGARRIFEQTAARFADKVWPRIYLSRAIIAEGKDPAAAEHVLREILRLDPKNREALEKLKDLPKLMGRN